MRWWGSREAASVRTAERGRAAWRGGGPGAGRRELGRAVPALLALLAKRLRPGSDPSGGACALLAGRVGFAAPGGGSARLPPACQLCARAPGRWAEAPRLFGLCVCVCVRCPPWGTEPPGVPRCWGE